MNTRSQYALAVVILLALPACDKKSDVEQMPAANATKQQLPSVPPKSAVQESQSSSANHGSPESVALIRKRVWDDVLKLSDGGLSPDKWRAFRQRYWTPNLDQVVVKSEQAKTVSVMSILTPPPNKKPLIVQLATGRFVDVTDPTEQESLLALHALAMITASSGGVALPTFFEERSKSPDITEGDVVLFQVFGDAFVSVSRRESVSDAELVPWHTLARSPNGPIRLLALRNFRHVAPNTEQWLKFYRLYTSEADEGILDEVVDLTFQIARPEAAQVLADIRTRSTPGLNAEQSSKLERSIAWLQKLPAQ